MTSDEIFYLFSSASEHADYLFLAERAMDFEMWFSIGAYFLYFLNADIFQEEYRFLIPFTEGSQFIYLYQGIMIPFMFIDFGIDFDGFDEILFRDALVAVIVQSFD